MRNSLVLVAALALAGCTDQLASPTHVGPPQDGPKKDLSYLTQYAEWRGSWHHDSMLYVYDTSTDPGMNTHAGDSPQMLKLRDDLGMRYYRMGVYWNWYKADPCPSTAGGANRGCQLANTLNWIQNNGNDIEMVVDVLNGPGCRDTSSPYNYGPACYVDPQWKHRYADFLVEMVTNYPRVRYWQLWNEPDGGYAGSPEFGMPPAACGTFDRYNMGREYAEMLKIAYPRIKAAAAGRPVWVLTAGMTGSVGGIPNRVGRLEGFGCGADATGELFHTEVPWSFIKGMYSNGARGNFDVLALHTYGRDPWSTGGIVTKTNTLIHELASSGYPTPPIWITEFGADAANSSNNGRDLPADRNQWRSFFDEQQRSYYETAFGFQSSERKVQKVIGYHMAADFGGAFFGPTASYNDSFHPNFGDSDWRSYGTGIFRINATTSYEELHNPRPAAVWLMGQAGSNRAGRNIDAQGGRNGKFRIPVFASIPRDHPFGYVPGSSDLEVGPINVNARDFTAIPFVTPLLYQASVGGIGPMPYNNYNNQVAGYETQERYMDRLRLQLLNIPGVGNLCYQVRQAGYGDRPVVCSDFADPWTGVPGYRLETVRIVPQANPTWSVCYQVFSWGYGWSSWACDGDWGGTVGRGFGAIRIRVQRK
jgi:hypothetical protein